MVSHHAEDGFSGAWAMDYSTTEVPANAWQLSAMGMMAEDK